MTDRLPPHSEEAEQAVLGCILWEPKECLPVCQEVIGDSSGWFYDLRHEAIFKAIVELANEMKPVELIGLQQRLKDAGMLDQVGGLAYLASLQDRVPSAANLPYYLDIAAEKATLRKLIRTCTNIVGRAYTNEGEAKDIVDEAEREILSVGQARGGVETKSNKQLVIESMAKLEQLHASGGAITGIPTGLDDLDKKLDGLTPGELNLISGYPSTGKTSLAMNIAEHVTINLGKSVAVFSLEMTAEALMQRAHCSVAKVSRQAIIRRSATEDDFKRLAMAGSELAKAPMHIRAVSDLSVDTMRAMARRIKQQHGLDLIVVDYMQKLSAKTRKDANRTEELGQISAGCKACAMELNVPLILLSQLTDDGKIYGSREPGMDADVMLEIKNDGEWLPDNQPVKVTIRKSRNGEAGESVPLLFRKSITRFECVAKVQDEDVPYRSNYD